MNTEFSLKRENPNQAGKLALKLYYESLGYQVLVAEETEQYSHDGVQCYAMESLVWGVSVGFFPIAFLNAGYQMFVSCLKQIGDTDLKKYTHIVTVFEETKSVCIYGNIHKGHSNA